MTTPPKAPKCETCSDHGEIGCLRPDGYDGERCPDCNPAEVKRYHVTEAGLVEGSALGRLNVVLASDYDAAVTHIRGLEILAGQEMKSTELATNASPAKPRPTCVGLERFESEGEDFVRLQDVIDLVGQLKAEQPAPVAVGHPFADKVIRKLERFQECADDGQGADIGRHWFDLLTQLGLLNRVQRSPALWEMTQQGEDALELSRQNAKPR